MKLADKYRPQTFEEILGHDQIVQIVHNYVFASGPISVLISGHYGTGKTSLARIVAKGTLCRNRSSTGSPCLHCTDCKEMERRVHPNCQILDCGERGGKDNVIQLIDDSRHSPMRGGRRVIILDEAHNISPAGLEALLAFVEKPPPFATVILLTTRLEQIPEAVQSRCQKFEMKLLHLETAAAYARDICAREKMPFDESALLQIVKLSEGVARDLLTNVGQVAEYGAISVENVRQHFNLGQIDVPVEYLHSVLMPNDISQQVAIIEHWNLRPHKKAEWLQRLLIFVFFRHVKGLHRPDAMMTELSEESGAAIASAVGNRAASLEIPVGHFWSELTKFWSRQSEQLSAGSLVSMLIEFDLMLNGGREGARKVSAAHIEENGTSSKTHIRRPRHVSDTTAKGPAPAKRSYLSLSQVGAIWNAASFMVQEYGVWFNARATLNHQRLGNENVVAAQRLVSELIRQLKMSVRRASPTAEREFHWIYVHERERNIGLRTHIALSIMPSISREISSWLQNSFFRRSFDGLLQSSVARVVIGNLAPPEQQQRRHFYLLRLLCRSVDPSLSVRDEAGELLPLKNALKIPGRLVSQFDPIEVSQRFRVAETIGVRSQRRKDPAVSRPSFAFQERRWSWLDRGWEINEFSNRTRWRREYENEIAMLKAKYAGREGEIWRKRFLQENEKLDAALKLPCKPKW